jgi:lipopolysaccharide cholinephosphotransferase
MNSIVSLTIIILLLCLFIWINRYHTTCIRNIDELIMTPEEKKSLFSYLQIISDLFNKNNINYWIMSGTLLGSIRHNGMIPWDDDADIGVNELDLEKILALNNELNPLGYEIVPSWKIYKFKKIGVEYPFVDIFGFSKDNNKYILNHIILRNMWPNEYFTEDELFPLKIYKFENIYLKGPNYPIAYLDRMYHNWRFIGRHTGNHKSNRCVDITLKLNEKNEQHKLKPYVYIKPSQDAKSENDIHHNEKIITIKK